MSEALKSKILTLIEQTADPVQKAHLLVMLQFHDLLAENTQATRQVAEDTMAFRRAFEDHKKQFVAHSAEELKVINQGKGMWRVLVWFYGIAQACIVGLGGVAWADYKDVKQRVVQLEKEHAVINERQAIAEKQASAAH